MITAWAWVASGISTWAAGVAVGHQAGALHGPRGFEARPELLVGGRQGQIADKNMHVQVLKVGSRVVEREDKRLSSPPASCR